MKIDCMFCNAQVEDFLIVEGERGFILWKNPEGHAQQYDIVHRHNLSNFNAYEDKQPRVSTLGKVLADLESNPGDQALITKARKLIKQRLGDLISKEKGSGAVKAMEIGASLLDMLLKPVEHEPDEWYIFCVSHKAIEGLEEEDAELDRLWDLPDEVKDLTKLGINPQSLDGSKFAPADMKVPKNVADRLRKQIFAKEDNPYNSLNEI